MYVLLEMGRNCDPMGQTIQEKLGAELITAQDFMKDPRVIQAVNPGHALEITRFAGDRKLPPHQDLNWHQSASDLPSNEVKGIGFYIYEPDNISPLNQILLAPYLIDTAGQHQRISDDLRKRIRVTSTDPSTIRITDTPRKRYAPNWQLKHQTISAHSPGQAKITMRFHNHTVTQTLTVQPPPGNIPRGATQLHPETRPPGIRYLKIGRNPERHHKTWSNRHQRPCIRSRSSDDRVRHCQHTRWPDTPPRGALHKPRPRRTFLNPEPSGIRPDRVRTSAHQVHQRKTSNDITKRPPI